MASLMTEWRLNVAGKFAEGVREELVYRYDNAEITVDPETSPHELILNQIEHTTNDLFFIWQEDHWFVCPHVNLLHYILEEFQASAAEHLCITHLRTAWKRKPDHLSTVMKKILYREYEVSLQGQQRIWEDYPRASVLGIPAILKRDLLVDIIEHHPGLLTWLNSPVGLELPYTSGRLFLRGRSYTEMVPAFHIFREVHEHNWRLRGVDTDDVKKWVQLRDVQGFGDRFEKFR